MRIDWRTIKNKTGCTEEQAKTLANEFRNLLKVQKTFMSNLDQINLRNCTRVEVKLVDGYMDTIVNVCGFRKINSIVIFGEEHFDEQLHRYTVNSILDELIYQVI